MNYENTCKTIIEKINQNIIDNWYFSIYENWNKIYLVNNNRIGIIENFNSYFELFMFLKWIWKFLNLLYNDNIEINKKTLI